MSQYEGNGPILLSYGDWWIVVRSFPSELDIQDALSVIDIQEANSMAMWTFYYCNLLKFDMNEGNIQ